MSSALTENRVYFAKLAYGLILDCGCGFGLYAKILKKRGRVVGADINKNSLINVPYQHKVLCSITNLPFKTDAFDFAWTCAVIEHVKENCILEVIRTGKHAIFLTPNKNSPLELIRKLMGKKGTWETPDHERLYTVSELKKYGKVFGDSCGLPKRSLWIMLLPNRLWLFLPRLSHSIILYSDKKKLKVA